MYEVWTDGSCRPKCFKKNKSKTFGPSSIGIVIKLNKETIFSCSKFIGVEFDNNQAEYEALIQAIDKLIDIGASSVLFHTDSNLIEKQMNGKYCSRSELLTPYYLRAKRMIQLIPEWNIKWIPRERNREADKLASTAIEEWVNEYNFDLKSNLT